MKHFIINVPGNHGYSFMVCGDFNEDEAIDLALKAGLFEDDEDADYAFVDNLVSDRDIEHFKKCGCCYEC